jgi:hypothetical protein
MAQTIAARLKSAGSGNGVGGGVAAGAAAPASGTPAPAQARGQGGAGGQGGAAGFARVLQHSPEIHVADLRKGDAVMIVATAGNPDSATAIRLIAGVEPMLQASASGSQSMFSSSWSLGGGSAGGDQGGGEGAP